MLYVPASGSSPTLDGGNVANNIVIEDSSYVIVRGFKLANARESAIRLKSRGPAHDIVIENNEITNWGRINPESQFAEDDSGIRTDNGNGTNFAHLIIQRNYIHDPRGDANSWDEYRVDGERCKKGPPVRCHPEGADAISIRNTAGNHVIRYNEIAGSATRHFMDGIQASDDDSVQGGYGPDSDIYGNKVSGVWDDAIETEGGNRNVRIWGNFIDETFVAFGLAPVLEGPVYLFRNVVHRTLRSIPEGYRTGAFVKIVSTSDSRSGRVYVLHNTVWVGPDGRGGVKSGVNGTETCLVNIFARNNIIRATGNTYVSTECAEAASNDIDFDLYTGRTKNIPNAEQNGIARETIYAAPDSLALKAGTAGADDALALPNLSDDAIGEPDRGAQESGGPVLEFGTSAYTSAY